MGEPDLTAARTTDTYAHDLDLKMVVIFLLHSMHARIVMRQLYAMITLMITNERTDAHMFGRMSD